MSDRTNFEDELTPEKKESIKNGIETVLIALRDLSKLNNGVVNFKTIRENADWLGDLKLPILKELQETEDLYYNSRSEVAMSDAEYDVHEIYRNGRPTQKDWREMQRIWDQKEHNKLDDVITTAFNKVYNTAFTIWHDKMVRAALQGHTVNITGISVETNPNLQLNSLKLEFEVLDGGTEA